MFCPGINVTYILWTFCQSNEYLPHDSHFRSLLHLLQVLFSVPAESTSSFWAFKSTQPAILLRECFGVFVRLTDFLPKHRKKLALNLIRYPTFVNTPKKPFFDYLWSHYPTSIAYLFSRKRKYCAKNAFETSDSTSNLLDFHVLAIFAISDINAHLCFTDWHWCDILLP